MAETLTDGGPIYGSTYDVTIDGYAYTLRTADHSLPVAGDEIRDSSGKFKGHASIVQRQQVSVEIDAITGTPAPSQLVPFSQAFHGYAAKWWAVHDLTIKSSQTSLRTYTAVLKENKNAPS